MIAILPRSERYRLFTTPVLIPCSAKGNTGSQQFRSLTSLFIFFLLLAPLTSVAQEHADRLAPTLLMTGDEDFRIPISEAEQYYAALKLLKVESALVRFPGEPHGLSRHPSHQIAKVVYTLNFRRAPQDTLSLLPSTGSAKKGV